MRLFNILVETADMTDTNPKKYIGPKVDLVTGKLLGSDDKPLAADGSNFDDETMHTQEELPDESKFLGLTTLDANAEEDKKKKKKKKKGSQDQKEGVINMDDFSFLLEDVIPQQQSKADVLRDLKVKLDSLKEVEVDTTTPVAKKANPILSELYLYGGIHKQINEDEGEAGPKYSAPREYLDDVANHVRKAAVQGIALNGNDTSPSAIQQAHKDAIFDVQHAHFLKANAHERKVKELTTMRGDPKDLAYHQEKLKLHRDVSEKLKAHASGAVTGRLSSRISRNIDRLSDLSTRSENAETPKGTEHIYDLMRQHGIVTHGLTTGDGRATVRHIARGIVHHMYQTGATLKKDDKTGIVSISAGPGRMSGLSVSEREGLDHRLITSRVKQALDSATANPSGDMSGGSKDSTASIRAVYNALKRGPRGSEGPGGGKFSIDKPQAVSAGGTESFAPGLSSTQHIRGLIDAGVELQKTDLANETSRMSKELRDKVVGGSFATARRGDDANPHLGGWVKKPHMAYNPNTGKEEHVHVADENGVLRPLFHMEATFRADHIRHSSETGSLMGSHVRGMIGKHTEHIANVTERPNFTRAARPEDGGDGTPWVKDGEEVLTGARERQQIYDPRTGSVTKQNQGRQEASRIPYFGQHHGDNPFTSLGDSVMKEKAGSHVKVTGADHGGEVRFTNGTQLTFRTAPTFDHRIEEWFATDSGSKGRFFRSDKAHEAGVFSTDGPHGLVGIHGESPRSGSEDRPQAREASVTRPMGRGTSGRVQATPGLFTQGKNPSVYDEPLMPFGDLNKTVVGRPLSPNLTADNTTSFGMGKTPSVKTLVPSDPTKRTETVKIENGKATAANRLVVEPEPPKPERPKRGEEPAKPVLASDRLAEIRKKNDERIQKTNADRVSRGLPPIDIPAGGIRLPHPRKK